MSEDYYEQLVGFLEYDPNIDITDSENRYRGFLSEKAKFFNPVQIKDYDIIKKIHLNYRLIFLKDTATASWIDDISLSTIDNVCWSIKY